jgi:catechol 2,3-dioxygenase-like lactoylglutathione lyase family enzyme
MIIRIFRAQVQPGMQAQYEALLRDEAIPGLSEQAGVVAVYGGKSIPQSPDEFVMVSLWNDLTSLKAFAGEHWMESIPLPGEEHLIKESVIHGFTRIEPKNATFQKVIPVLAVRNVTDAIAFYTAKLGFELRGTDRSQDPNYAVVGRGGVRLHLQWHDEPDFAGEMPELRFVIDDVDTLFEEYRTKDVFHSRTALRDTPWGTREFAFYDPDGNGLIFFRDL